MNIKDDARNLDNQLQLISTGSTVHKISQIRQLLSVAFDSNYETSEKLHNILKNGIKQAEDFIYKIRKDKLARLKLGQYAVF